MIAGIGRSWVDEILWEAQLSPYKRGADLDEEEAERLREAIVDDARRGDRPLRAGDHAADPRQAADAAARPPPRRASPARAAPTTLEAVHFEDYVIAYCPACQTEGRVLKDRRLSRLLK